MTKISILGAGSIGCWIGGHLVEGGGDVSLIGRDRFAADIKSNGLTLTHFERSDIHLDEIPYETHHGSLAVADIIILCTKSQDTEKAAIQIAENARSDVTIVSFQNGIRNAEILKSVLPPSMTVIPAIVPFNVTPSGKGRFHCGTAGDLVLATDIEAVTHPLKKSGQGIKVSENIDGDQWAKMIVNLNNGLNTLCGTTLRACLLQRDYRQALAVCVEEALNVADERGVKIGEFNGRSPELLLKILRLPNWAYRLVMQFVVKIDKKARSSMLDDLETGRVSEIDYLQGEIVRQAKKTGHLAPRNQAVYEAVRLAFDQGISPKLNGTDLLKLVSS